MAIALESAVRWVMDMRMGEKRTLPQYCSQSETFRTRGKPASSIRVRQEVISKDPAKGRVSLFILPKGAKSISIDRVL